jgi:peptidoglycan/xylan/chitin deacetylase (PgdA/CDA1 family)
LIGLRRLTESPAKIVRNSSTYLPQKLWLQRAFKSTGHLDMRDRKVIVLLSSDTEFDPPWGSATWNRRSTTALLDGLPRIVDLCDRHSISATFFCEGRLVKELPGVFRDLGVHHEIGCHSFAHEWLGVRPPYGWIQRREEFPILPVGRKITILRDAARCIREAVGQEPKAFKAPFNSVDHPSTLRLLDQVGFETDSSLPNYFESYARPLRPTPCRHASEEDLWADGKMRLVEVPFMIRLQPLFLHPFSSYEDALETISKDLDVALNSVDAHCRIDSFFGRTHSVVHVSSHPWEFSDLVPRGLGGGKNIRQLDTYLDELSRRYDLEYLTVSEFRQAWEREYCRLHSRKE